MKSISKLITVLLLFTIVFFILRLYGSYFNYDVDLLIGDLGGLTYLYSTIGTIFAIFAAFVIVSESQDWTSLVNASKNEIREVNELWLWSRSLSSELQKEFNENIEKYLNSVVNDEWKKIRQGKDSLATSKILENFHFLISKSLPENQQTYTTLLSSFNNILNYRSIRIEYSYEPLAKILKITVILVAVALIFLSLFIGVHNLWLDYIFMFCIVALGTVILIVVDDLDNPLRPGDWYLSPEGYSNLLSNINLRK